MTEKQIKIRSYPKTIFLIPTNVMSFVCALMMFIGNIFSWEFWALIWVGTLTMSLLTMAFKMTITKVILIILATCGMIGALFFSIQNPDIPEVFSIHPMMLLLIGVILSALTLITWISKRFEYYVITESRIWHKQGWFMREEKKYDAIGCVIGIEQGDLLEKLIGDSGTLTIVTGDRHKHFVIQNVFGITRKKEKIHALTGRMAVQNEE